MDQRLDSIYKLIDKGSKGVCDVGTDHGFIPVRLAQEGFKGSIVASDINALPLKTAEANARAAGVYDRITFLRYDGLPEHLSESFDTAVIAGMGGDLICSIIDRADWIFSPGYTMILQPMTKQEVLRYYLINNGFTISDDVLATDGIRIYQIIKCSFTSVNDTYSEAELYTGKRSRCNDHELFLLIVQKFSKNLDKIISGTEGSGESEKLTYYKSIARELDGF